MENQVNNQEEVFTGTKQEVLSKFEALLDSQSDVVAGGKPPEYSLGIKLSTSGGGSGEVSFGIKF